MITPGAIMGAVGGIAGIAGGIIGGGKRRREQRAAQQEMQRAKNQMMNLDTSNLAANLQNPYEDLTVNTQAADFQAQQNQAMQANIMSQMGGAAGGSGIAALAQTMANQGAQQAQAASASIAQQETQNAMMAAKGDMSIQAQQVAGAEAGRGLDYQKTNAMMGMAQQRLGAANQARAQAKAQQMSAIGDIGKVGLSAVGFAGKMAGGGGNALSKLADGATALGSTGGGYNPYEVEMDYQQMIDRPISVDDPNPPELTSLNIPGAGDYSGGFGKVFNPITGQYE